MAVEQQSGSTRLTARRGHDRPGSGSNPQLVPGHHPPFEPGEASGGGFDADAEPAVRRAVPTIKV